MAIKKSAKNAPEIESVRPWASSDGEPSHGDGGRNSEPRY
jgi:hypothetical protein